MFAASQFETPRICYCFNVVPFCIRNVCLLLGLNDCTRRNMCLVLLRGTSMAVPLGLHEGTAVVIKFRLAEHAVRACVPRDRDLLD
jgi:hypothetical protein